MMSLIPHVAMQNLPDLAVLRFAAYDHAHRTLGWAALPLNSLRPGYRHIPLHVRAAPAPAREKVACCVLCVMLGNYFCSC